MQGGGCGGSFSLKWGLEKGAGSYGDVGGDLAFCLSLRTTRIRKDR